MKKKPTRTAVTVLVDTYLEPEQHDRGQAINASHALAKRAHRKRLTKEISSSDREHLSTLQNFPHYVAAVVATWKKDYERWAYEGDRALALNPNFALALSTRGNLYMYTGEPAKAIPYIERAIRLDPVAPHGQSVHFLGLTYFVAGEYETAATCFKDRIAMNPTTDLSRAFLASALGHLGRQDEAHRYWRELKEIKPGYSHENHFSRLPFKDPAETEKLTDGLRKAGLAE